MAKLSFRFAAVPDAVLNDPHLKPIDIKVVGKFARLAKGHKIWASNGYLASLLGVSLGTIKYSVRRLEAAGYIRRVRGGIPGARRVLELLWLFPAAALALPLVEAPAAAAPAPVVLPAEWVNATPLPGSSHDPFFGPGPRVNETPPEGSTDDPLESHPPDPPIRSEREETQRDGGGMGPVDAPVAPAIAAVLVEEPPPPFSDLSTSEEEPPIAEAAPEPAAPEVIAAIERIAPQVIPGREPARWVQRLARDLGVSLGWALKALERAQGKSLHSPRGYVVRVLQGYRREGGPPPSPEDLSAHQDAEEKATIAFLNAHLFGREAPA